MASCGTLTVEKAAPDFTSGNVNLESCRLVDDTVEPGDAAAVRVTLRNRNASTADARVNVKVNGNTTNVQSVTIPAQSSQQVTVDVDVPAQEGQYNISTSLSGIGAAGVSSRATTQRESTVPTIAVSGLAGGCCGGSARRPNQSPVARAFATFAGTRR